MSTSNVTSFNMASDEIVKAAMRKLSVLGDNSSPTPTQLIDGTTAMNMMLQTFTTKGMPLWVITEYEVIPTTSREYRFGLGQPINIPAPLKVTQVIRKDNLGDSMTPMSMYTHYDYNLLSSSANTGAPTIFWYEPLNQTGVLHVWPTPDNYTITNSVFKVVYQRPFNMMVNSGDTLDFPPWWHEAIVFGLASRLAPDFGIPIQDRSEYRQLAQQFLDEALSFGTEEGSLFIQPEWNW